jgi:hypothetical protein
MVRGVLTASFALAAVVVAGPLGSAPSEASSAPAAVAAQAPQLSQLLGVVDGTLVRVDSKTLRALSGKGIAVGSGGCAPRQGGTACWSVPPWTASPDATQLAIARNDASSLRLVDARRMRVTADMRLDGGAVGALAWLTGRRVLALQEVASERQRLIAVDIAKRRIVARRALGGSVLRLARAARELLILLAPAQAIGPARIAVADSQGAVRFVRLERILAGSKLLGTGSDHRVDSRLPGLAVDPQGRRAFVVDRSLTAEIDLRSLTVSYHTLERSASFLGRLRNWLEPAAQAKQVSGHVRSARWLGGDLLAVSGTDTEQTATQPVGLLVVDTRSWNIRTIERRATSFVVAGDLLLATGSSWDPATSKTTGIGIAAYGFDGQNRFQLFDGESAWVAQVYGGRAHVGISGQEAPLQIVDLAAGRVVGERRPPLPWLVQGVAAGWWEG